MVSFEKPHGMNGPHQDVVEDLRVEVHSYVRVVGFLDFEGIITFLKAELWALPADMEEENFEVLGLR